MPSKLIQLLATLCLALSTCLLADPANAGRVALVIGNAQYEHTVPLANPRNDAAAIAAALRQLEFEVFDGYDLTRSEFEDLVRNFARSAESAETAVLYYAGHGLEVGGVNYLVPVDARIQDENDLKFETVTLTDVLGLMEREDRTNLVFLDACRDNPMTGNLARTMGTRSTNIGRGLAPVDTGVGTLIAYSTQPGNVALDGAGKHSPFTDALLAHIATPALDVELMMRRVRRDVMDMTGGQQVPWSNSSLTGGFVFQSEAPEAIETATVVVPMAPQPQQQTNGAAEPRMAIEEKHQTTVTDEPSEELRLSALSPTPSQPATGTAPGTPSVTLPQRAEPVTAETTPAAPMSGAELARRSQAALNRLGCDAGTEDGIWGRKSQNALQRLAEHAPSVRLTSADPTELVLRQMELFEGRICPLTCAVTENKVGDTCVRKTCSSGQRLSSKGECYTPQAAAKKPRRSSPGKSSGGSSSCFTYNGQTFCD